MLFTSAHTHDRNLFGLLAQRWQEWRSRQQAFAGLENCGRDEIARMAHDLALTSGELRTLARKGADAASLLYRRMTGLGLDRAAIARDEGKILWDMQKNCSLCDSKRRCRHDFARGADASAWRDYCPNDDTLAVLAPVAMASGRAGGANAALAADDHRGRNATLLGVLLIGLAWLVLFASPPAGLRGTPDTSALPAVTEPMPGPAVACLDASCLSTQQLSALQSLRNVQTQGLIASSAAEVAGLPQAARIAQGVHAGEAQACTSLGGTAWSGFMFQDGCATGASAAARLEGYNECRPMAGGGACLLR
jgi:hypothetical protein